MPVHAGNDGLKGRLIGRPKKIPHRFKVRDFSIITQSINN
jgi:hypothetical protein